MHASAMILEVLRAMLQPEPNVDRLSSMLGEVVERQASSGMRFKPSNASFSSAWLSMDASKGLPPPKYVELTFQSPSTMTVPDLAKMFGPWKRAPLFPKGPAYSIVFSYDNSKLQRTATIHADLSAAPESSNARVEKLTMLPSSRT